MVVQRTLDNLRDKPHEEKKVVAGGIAIAVVVVLLIGWGFLFLRTIKKGGTIPTLQAGLPEDQIDTQFMQQTQQQINQYYQSSSDQLRNLREGGSAAGSVDAGAGVQPNGDGGGFGAQNNDF